MTKIKCPLWKSNRGSAITCKYGTVVRIDYGTAEKMKLYKGTYCESMNYKNCPIFQTLNKEEK